MPAFQNSRSFFDPVRALLSRHFALGLGIVVGTVAHRTERIWPGLTIHRRESDLFRAARMPTVNHIFCIHPGYIEYHVRLHTGEC